MSTFDVVKEVAKDCAKGTKGVIEKYAPKVEKGFDDFVNKVSDKMEYYGEKSEARERLKSIKSDYDSMAEQLAVRVAESKINNPNFCAIEELKAFRVVKAEYERALANFNERFESNKPDDSDDNDFCMEDDD